MSQKAKIISVKHSGAPVYRGEHYGTDSFITSPDKIMNWLCDGYRTRFNQHRSNRQKYDKNKNLTPIGDNVIDITDKQARIDYSYLSAIPAMILQAPEKKENTEWFSAVKRRKTLKDKGVKNPGKMPRFKSRKKEDQYFTCWYNNGANAKYHKTGKNTGVIIITGRNPKNKKKSLKSKTTWKITIRIKTYKDIQPYTSITVNWSKQSVVFTSLPQSCKENKIHSNRAVGIDRGGVIPLATSDNNMITPDKKIIDKYESKKKYYQKEMGKARSRASKIDKTLGNKNHEHMYKVMRGYNYQENKKKANKYSRKIAAYKYAWLQEVTTLLVRKYGVIVLEDLKVKSMTRKGGKRKKGMNRSFLTASPSMIAELLEYKVLLNGKRLVYVPAHYTSQRCSKCGYTSKDNRESQSIFHCQDCSYKENADINAANNILALYEFILEGTDLSTYDPSDYMNDGGEIIRPKIPTGMGEEFFKPSIKADLDDAIDPVKVTHDTPSI